jgi:pentatricopeptide repeat protein
MIAKNFIPSTQTYSQIIKSIINLHPLEASRLVSDMRSHGLTPGTNIYNILIHGHVKAGRLDLAKASLNEMRENGIQPNIYSCNALILGLTNAGQFNAALSFIEKMKTSGIPPNTITYNTLLDAYVTRSMWSNVNEIVKQMFQDP